MTLPVKHPWKEINSHYMNEDYRVLVISQAIEHFPRASFNLRQSASRALSRINIPGASSFRTAKLKQATKCTITPFQEKEQVAKAIISLWAETKQEIIIKLQFEAEKAGFRFQKEWSWEKAAEGYIDYNDLGAFNKFLDLLVQDMDKPESDHFKLAALWISGSLVLEENLIAEGPMKENGREVVEKENDKSADYSVEETPKKEAVAPVPEVSSEDLRAIPSIHLIPAVPQENYDLKNENFADLGKMWEDQLASLERAKNDASEISKCLYDHIAQNHYDQAKNLIEQIAECLNACDRNLLELRNLTDRGVYLLSQEFMLRPDLKKPDLFTTQKSEEDPHGLLIKVQGGKEALHVINDYDKERRKVVNNLDILSVDISKMRNAIRIWQSESIDDSSNLNELDDVESMTLSDLEKIEQEKEVELQLLSVQRYQLREMSINNARATITSLKETIPNDQDFQVFNLSITTLENEDFSSWDDEDLRSIENALNTTLQEQLALSKSRNAIIPATELKAKWDDKVLVDLLKCLAIEKREVEAFLLHLSAIKVHPKSDPDALSHDVVRNLLNGLGQISSNTKPLEFLSWIAPAFLSSFTGQDEQTQAEICLLALATHISSDTMQPSGYLWQIAAQWPIPRMHSWEKLWQSTLLEETIPIYTDEKQSALQATLLSKRKNAEIDLLKDGAHYVRLSSLQSTRLKALLSKKLMPNLTEKMVLIKKHENELDKAEFSRLPVFVSRFRDVFNDQIKPDLVESNLLKQYETGLYDDRIDEAEPFHHKVSQRILLDCAASVLEYGSALLEYWELIESRSNGLNARELRTELSQLTDLSAFCATAYEQIFKSCPKERIPWDEAYSGRLALEHLIKEVLTQSTCVIHLPHLVADLVNRRLDWDSILEDILEDIVEPFDPETAASFLLAKSAPSQALSLIQYLPLEKQKKAQEMRSENERSMSSYVSELLQLDGNIEEYTTWRDIGRWGYLLEKVKSDIEVLQELKESRLRAASEKSLELRQRINTIDSDLFQTKNEMPLDSYERIMKGLSIARRASETETLFLKVEEFLQEITYRLEHRSWSTEELHEAVNVLDRAMVGSVDQPSVQRTAKEILEFFDTGQLGELNLSQDDISPSEINTRVDLLNNWISVKQRQGVLTEDLLQNGVAAIQNLFRYFAQMVSMKRYRSIDGKEMANTVPLVYEYWQLEYPRTASLDNQCIFLALPGNPPTIAEIKKMQEFIEDKEFLEDYFVILFIPGCDEKARRRFLEVGEGKGLVLVDEPTLLKMILAEADSRNPVGVLRPIMLDAINGNPSIFTYNQTVDTRTAIFLGRDREINNIVRSGANYPIYGGRRIGKSSLLKAVEQRLIRKNVHVVSYSLEGEKDLSDEAVSIQLAKEIGFYDIYKGTNDFKTALTQYLEEHPDMNLVLMLDEVDRYIQVNKQRHILIEALRATSDRFGNRFRVIIAGFMELYDCLSGRGPYSQTSDPWRRMLNKEGPLGNLTPVNAENIVKEGFKSILGWKFENRAIPQLIVERTGGHPAFVQEFCYKLLERVRGRGDKLVRIADIDAVFEDNDPKHSFIAYVRETLEMNLDAIGRYLVVMLASRPNETLGFTWDEIREIAEVSSPPIPEARLKRSLEYLSVTSVVREVQKQVYEYTVPDYPNILRRLGDTGHLEDLEKDLKKELG